MIIKNSAIIFHRSNWNAEESLKRQQAFLKYYRLKEPFADPHIIDYMTGDSYTGRKINELIARENSRFKIIFNSCLSYLEYNQQYDMQTHFRCLNKINLAELYHLDSYGALYKKVDSI